jgi:hypothetical protein
LGVPVPLRNDVTAGDGRTPPQIVADSMMPPTALTFFLAQELEAWGFTINSGDGCLIVRAGDKAFEVEVRGA